MARPKQFDDDTVVYICAQGGVRLQKNSDRRRIVDIIIEEGGRTTIGTVVGIYGAGAKDRILALIRVGWLEVAE